MRTALLVLCGLAAAAARADTSTGVDPGDRGGCSRLPDGWRLRDLAAATHPDAPGEVTTTRVLAWDVVEIGRRSHTEIALVWVALTGGRWDLAQLARHAARPCGPGCNPAWHVVGGGEERPFHQRYAHPPTRADLDRFVDGIAYFAWYRRSLPVDRSEICRDAWLRAFGAPPWRRHPG